MLDHIVGSGQPEGETLAIGDLVVLKMSGNGSQALTFSQSDGSQVTEYVDLGALVI